MKMSTAPKGNEALFGRGRLLRFTAIRRIGIARRRLAVDVGECDDAFAGEIGVDNNRALLFEIAKQPAGTAGGMRAIGAGNARVGRTWLATDGRLCQHEENALEIVADGCRQG